MESAENQALEAEVSIKKDFLILTEGLDTQTRCTTTQRRCGEDSEIRLSKMHTVCKTSSLQALKDFLSLWENLCCLPTQRGYVVKSVRSVSTTHDHAVCLNGTYSCCLSQRRIIMLSVRGRLFGVKDCLTLWSNRCCARHSG